MENNNIAEDEIDYAKKTVNELKALCKERNIIGISKKIKADLIDILRVPINNLPAVADNAQEQIILRQDIIHGDTIKILPTFTRLIVSFLTDKNVYFGMPLM